MYVTRHVAEQAAANLCRALPSAPEDCEARVLGGCSSATTDAHTVDYHDLVGISSASNFGPQLMQHVPGSQGVIGPLQ
jgi:hypothetical protein